MIKLLITFIITFYLCFAVFAAEPIMTSGGNSVYFEYADTDVTTLTLSVNRTYSLETQRPGITHLLEHSVFITTKNHSEPFSFQQYLEREGIISSAITDFNTFTIKFEGRTDKLPLMAKSIKELIDNVIFDAELISNEKTIVIKEARWQENNIPIISGIRTLSDIACGGEIYPIVGNVEEILSITTEDLKKHYEELFSLPYNITVLGPYSAQYVSEQFEDIKPSSITPKNIDNKKIGELFSSKKVTARSVNDFSYDQTVFQMLMYPYTSELKNDLPAKIIAASLTSGIKPLLADILYIRDISVYSYGVENIYIEGKGYFIVWAYLTGKDSQKFESAVNNMIIKIDTIMLNSDFYLAKDNLLNSTDKIFVIDRLLNIHTMSAPVSRQEYREIIDRIQKTDITFYPLAGLVIRGVNS